MEQQAITTAATIFGIGALVLIPAWWAVKRWSFKKVLLSVVETAVAFIVLGLIALSLNE